MIKSDKNLNSYELIEPKKIVSEQVINNTDESANYMNNSGDKEIFSQDEILNDEDRKIFNKHHEKLIKYNKNLVEICHKSKLIALKSLI